MRRVVIVGTVPYNTHSLSRAFESYFHGWNPEELIQIFSNPNPPVKGHCGSLCQITDRRILLRWLHPKAVTTVFFQREELPEVTTKNEDTETGAIKRLQRFGVIHKGALSHLLRGLLWRKKYWCTEALNKWLDAFKPECVFLAFSDDFFILQIALYIARKFNIPIISCIGDDYYFNYKKTISPIYHIYKLLYRKKVREVFSHNGSAIFIGNKIRDKYNSEFGLNGETCYVTSSIQRRPFRPLNADDSQICYFGNLLLGRNKSLVDIADALRTINTDYRIHVYSNDTDRVAWGILEEHPNIEFHGSVPYSVVQERTLTSDIILVVEGFDKKDVDITRYSLSTKVADALSSGVSVLGYGSIECGAIEYLKSCGCATVCTRKEELADEIKAILNDPVKQRENYDAAIRIVEENHRLLKSNQVLRGIVEREVVLNESAK